MDPSKDFEAIRRRREEIAETLRAELEAAQIFLKDVKDQYQRAVALVEDLGPNSPDGHQTLRSLVKEQRRALECYTAALRDFDRFVLHGIIPDRLRDSK